MKWITVFLCFLSAPVIAADAYITLVSDYRAYGVSQTVEQPTVQAGIDWSSTALSGAYLSLWGSGVDFEGEDTVLELDAFAGLSRSLSDSWSYDAGLAQYTYHGDPQSHTYAFNEIYLTLAHASVWGETALSQWYSWNYAGTDAGHHILQISHSLTHGRYTWVVLGDYSRSLDRTEWLWADDRGTVSGYRHYLLSWTAAFSLADVSVTAETTSLESAGSEATLILSLQRNFSF